MGDIIEIFDEIQMRYVAMETNIDYSCKVSEVDMERMEAEIIRFVDELALANWYFYQNFFETGLFIFANRRKSRLYELEKQKWYIHVLQKRKYKKILLYTSRKNLKKI